MHSHTDFRVTRGGAENVTSTVRGERASSTSSAQIAAERLGEKLYGPALIRVLKTGEDSTFVDLWRAEADEDHWASCDDEGLVYVMPVIPPLNTGLAHGPKRALLLTLSSVLEPLGRTVLDKKLIVLGVAEAATREAKDLAIAAWLRKQSARNGKRGSLSVLFSTTVVRCQL